MTDTITTSSPASPVQSSARSCVSGVATSHTRAETLAPEGALPCPPVHSAPSDGDLGAVETPATLLRREAEARSVCALAAAHDIATTLRTLRRYGLGVPEHTLRYLDERRRRFEGLASMAAAVERRLAHQIEGGPGEDEEPITRTHPAWRALVQHSGWRLLDRDVSVYLVEAQRNEEQAADLDAFMAGLGGGR